MPGASRQLAANPGAAAPDAVANRNRLESLTGLRWLAAFGVFCAHVNILLPIPGTHGLFGLGASGVTFFFVLSGFVLAWTAGERDTAGWFYARRFARIWPLLALSVGLPLLFALTSPQDVNRTNLLLIGVASVLLVQAWVPGWILEGPSPVTWSLSCEAAFYAVFPWVSRLMARRTLRTLAGVAAALVVVGWLIRIGLWLGYPPKANVTTADLSSSGPLLLGTYSPIARVHEFLLGVVAAVAMRRGWRSPVRPRTAVALLAVAFFGLWLLRDAGWRALVANDALDQVSTPLFALLIVAVATHELRGGRSVLRSEPLVRLGRYSYAFYLFHFTVVLSVASALHPGKEVADFFVHPVSPTWHHLGWAALALAVSVGLSALLYRWYEHPLERRLRRRLGRRLAPPGSAPSGPAQADAPAATANPVLLGPVRQP